MTPLERQELIEQALRALQQGDDVRALALADQLIADAPNEPAVRAIRAQALLSSEDPDEALDEARRAAEMRPDDQFARLLLAYAAWRTGKLTLAQQSFEEAVRLSGGRPKLLADYAWFMASERGPRLAEGAARQAIGANATSSTAWAALGLAQHRMHQRQDAEASLRRALELNPNDLYAQSAMVVLLQEKREDDKAVALTRLLEDVPGTEDFVETVRHEAKQRKIARMLVERKADPEPSPEPSRGAYWIWLAAAATLLASLLLILEPDFPGIVLFCVVVPVVALVIILRRFFD